MASKRPTDVSDWNNIQFDEQGRPYWTLNNGQRRLLTPMEARGNLSNPRVKAWGDASDRSTETYDKNPDPRPEAIPDYTDVRFDEQGRPYLLQRNGQRSYMSPLQAMQSPNARAQQWAASLGVTPDNPSGGSPGGGQGQPRNAFGFKDRGHWDPKTGRWTQDTDWENIVATALAGGVLGAGANAVAGSIFGGAGGAGAAGGTLPSSTIPGMHLAVPGAIASQGASAATPLLAPLLSRAIPGMASAVPAAISSQVASAATPLTGAALASRAIPGMHEAVPAPIGSQGVSENTPLGGVRLPVGTVETGGGGNGGGGSDIANAILRALAAAGAAGAFGGSGNQNTAESAEARRIQAITEARMRRVDPLHEAAAQLAYSRLPTNMQNGPLPRVPLPPPV